MASSGSSSKVRADRSRAIVAQTAALLYADFPLEKFVSKLARALVRALDADEAFIHVDDGKIRLDRSHRRADAERSDGARNQELTTPILFGGETLGALGVHSAHSYGENDRRSLEAIARYIAIAVRNRETVRAVVRPAKRLRQAVIGIALFAVLATLALAFYGFDRLRHIGSEAEALARGRAGGVAQSIDLSLTDADQLVRTAAAFAPGFTGDPIRAQRALHDLLLSAPRSTIYGVGLWYQPYAFSNERRLYGPYIHRNWRDRSKSLLTFFWDKPTYDYPRHDWYVLGRDAQGSTVFTQPYFDVNLVYVSAVHAFHDAQGRFIGVASVDLTLGSLRQVVEKASAPPSDLVYVTLKNGNVFVFPHQGSLLAYVRRRLRTDSILDVTAKSARQYIASRYGADRTDVTVPVSHVGWAVHDSMANAAVVSSKRTLWSVLVAAIALVWIAGAAGAFVLMRLRGHVERALDFELERERLQAELHARAESEARLRAATLHDDLTGVLNRAGLVQFIDEALHELPPDGAERFGVLFIDLDRFSRINDRVGRDAGDAILRDLAARLREVVGPSDALGRYGGDEFVIVKRESRDGGAVETAERIATLLTTPFTYEGRDVVVSASIGIAFGTREYASGLDLLRDADIAMFEMRSGARAHYAVFTPESRRRTQAQARLEAEIHHALERDEFRIVYQPIVNLATMRTVGFEALVRWEHPERGALLPGDFIPVAERSGSVLAIDRFVMQSACRDIGRLSNGREQLFVAVNLSALHFAHGALAAELLEIFKVGELNPGTLRLEITETALVDHPQSAAEMIRRLREFGVRVEIDDFGTGYSSLSYLQHLSIDGLKIDRSFVEGIDQRHEAAAIVRAIMELARALGLEVIAEGIETPAEAKCLQELHVRYGQGFWIARPLPLEEALSFTARDGAAQRR